MMNAPPPPSSNRRKALAIATAIAASTALTCTAFSYGGLVVPARTTAHSLAVRSAGSSSIRRFPTLRLDASPKDQHYHYLEPNNDDKHRKLGTSKILKFKPVATTAAALLGIFALTAQSAVAFGKKAAAPTAAVASPALVLPPISTLALACLLPTLLGYYKSEYGVSYGYGTAVASAGYLILSSIATSAGLPLLPCPIEITKFTSYKPAVILQTLATTLSTLASAAGPALKNLQALLPKSLPALHAFSLLFYGTRLDLFLLYREICLPRFRAMRERIEDRAKKQGSRWKRTPFLVSCAFLYFCMVCPLLITSTVCDGLPMVGSVAAVDGGLAGSLERMLRFSVFATLSGFLLGAFGDLNKSIGKAIQGEDELITWGVFRFFRHPNYTGEVIGWVSSCLAGFLAVAWKAAKSGASVGDGLALWKTHAPFLILSIMGAMGISFVLGTATAGLEFRQREKYGDTDKYKDWVKKSWVGFEMGQKKEEKSEE